VNHIPRLRAVPSVGNFSDHMTEDEWVGTPCGGCQNLTKLGELITKYRRSWWHKSCADLDIDSGNVVAAWISLGHDLARNPGSYRVKETRAIVGALLGMIQDPDIEMEAELDDEEMTS
jgi:hypothetical protein